MRASFGTGIRPPDAFEIAFTDNPELKPERSRSADFGVSHVLLPQLTVEATAFFNRYDDLIVAVGGSLCGREPLPHRQHLQRARARTRARKRLARPAWRACAAGLHVDVDGDPRGGSVGCGAAAVRGGRPADSPPSESGRRRSGMDAIGVFRVHDGPGREARCSTSSRHSAASAACSPRPASRSSMAARAGASPRTWRSSAAVCNLLDRQYEEAFGYPAPGRLGMVGLRVALRP